MIKFAVFALLFSLAIISVQAFNFQNGNNGALFWSMGCDWKGGDIGSVQVSGGGCGGACLSRSGCTHFTWTTFNGGTCWLKNSNVGGPIATDSSAMCGYLAGKGGNPAPAPAPAPAPRPAPAPAPRPAPAPAPAPARQPSGSTQVSVSGRQLIVNGQPFFGKGVCYSAVPRGQWPDSKDASMAWDWYSSPEVYNRDIPKFQQMNVNLIRTYGWRSNVNHNAFLDALHAAGVYIIIGWNWDWNLFSSPSGQAQMIADLTANVRNHAAHPAVLGWAVGNELNTHGGADPNAVWSFISQLRGVIHSTESQMGVTQHPVGSTVADGATLYDLISQRSSSVDIWFVQLYKGNTFYDFFTRYQAASSHPLIITEYGVDSYDGTSGREDEGIQASWLTSLTNEIKANKGVASGGCVFQFTDAWYACGNINQHDLCGGFTNGSPDHQENTEYYGLFRITNSQTSVAPNADTLQAKAAFNSLANAFRN